jgi:hypothetical protein
MTTSNVPELNIVHMTDEYAIDRQCAKYSGCNAGHFAGPTAELTQI